MSDTIFPMPTRGSLVTSFRTCLVVKDGTSRRRALFRVAESDDVGGATMKLPLTIHALSRLCECHLTVARRLLSIGLIEALTAGDTPLFDHSAVVRARKALRLKRDLRLNFDAMALVMDLLDRIDKLERRM